MGGRAPQAAIDENAEEVNMTECDERKRSSGDDDDDHRGHGGHAPQVQCAQQ